MAISEARVKELQENWNPAKYDDMQDGASKDMMIRIAAKFHDMSIEDYRKVLEDTGES